MTEAHPTVRYLIICDDVQVDPDNAYRVTIAGLISAIRSVEEPAYPLLYPELCVFLQFVECRGPAEGRVEIRHADTDQVAFRTRTRTIPFVKSPLDVMVVTFRIRNCLFPSAGLYMVQFRYNEQMIAEQPLLLK